jgi:hypothetical protein
MNLKSGFAFAFLLMFLMDALAQEKVLTAGFQIRPFFASKFFKTGTQQKDSSSVSFTVTPRGGYSAGGIIRYGISKTVSFETGINFVKRPHDVRLVKTTDGSMVNSVHTGFSSVSYEIPANMLVFIQLSERLLMDVALGVSLDFYPSNLNTRGENFNHYSIRKNWLFPAVNASIGYEWRTEKSGYFYLGTSYHNPLDDIFITTIGYYESGRYQTGQQFLLSGNYLSVDFRYFFHQDPLKKQKKKKN